MFSLLLLNIVVDIQLVQQKKERRHTNWKGRSKLSPLFISHITVYIKKIPKNLQKATRTNQLSKGTKHKDNIFKYHLQVHQKT